MIAVGTMQGAGDLHSSSIENLKYTNTCCISLKVVARSMYNVCMVY